MSIVRLPRAFDPKNAKNETHSFFILHGRWRIPRTIDVECGYPDHDMSHTKWRNILSRISRGPATLATMATPRYQLVDNTTALGYHLVSNCVRRAWLCGYDKRGTLPSTF